METRLKWGISKKFAIKITMEVPLLQKLTQNVMITFLFYHFYLNKARSGLNVI